MCHLYCHLYTTVLPATEPPHVLPATVLPCLCLYFLYRLQIMDDMHRVFDTGYFSLCKPVAEETRDGIKLTLEVGCVDG